MKKEIAACIFLVILVIAGIILSQVWKDDVNHSIVVGTTPPHMELPTDVTNNPYQTEEVEPTIQLPEIPVDRTEPTISPDLTLPDTPNIINSFFDVEPTHTVIAEMEFMNQFPSNNVTDWWMKQTYIVPDEVITVENLEKLDQSEYEKTWDEIKNMQIKELLEAYGTYVFYQSNKSTDGSIRRISLSCSPTNTVEHAIENGFWCYSMDFIATQTCSELFGVEYIDTVNPIIETCGTPSEIYYQEMEALIIDYYMEYDFEEIALFIGAIESEYSSLHSIIKAKIPSGIISLMVTGSEHKHIEKYNLKQFPNLSN
jgi:hypothetical protein